MKIGRLIGMFVVILIALHFVASGSIGLESKGQAQNPTIEHTISSGSAHNILKQNEQLMEEKPIYSTTTIVSLILAVLGIVVFRRNI